MRSGRLHANAVCGIVGGPAGGETPTGHRHRQVPAYYPLNRSSPPNDGFYSDLLRFVNPAAQAVVLAADLSRARSADHP